MKDFLGNTLSIHDEVVVTAPNYRWLTRAKIIAFTKHQVRVEYMNTWNYAAPGLRQEYLCAPSFLVLANSHVWPDECHESHKNVQPSGSEQYAVFCVDCKRTDYGSGVWGHLRTPCRPHTS